MKLFKSLFATVLLSMAAWAYALEIKPYTSTAFAAAQQANKPVALHFHANWCPTCRVQSTSLNELKSDASLPVQVFVVDYDNEKELRKQLKVRSQSTFIVYRGYTERARMAGKTSKEDIKAALKAGL